MPVATSVIYLSRASARPRSPQQRHPRAPTAVAPCLGIVVAADLDAVHEGLALVHSWPALGLLGLGISFCIWLDVPPATGDVIGLIIVNHFIHVPKRFAPFDWGSGQANT